MKCGLQDIGVYLDEIGAFFKIWEQHMQLLDKILIRLEANDFTFNFLKWKWGYKEVDWLGYWLTQIGSKPWKKCVFAIIHQEPPNYIRKVVIGAVNTY